MHISITIYIFTDNNNKKTKNKHNATNKPVAILAHKRSHAVSRIVTAFPMAYLMLTDGENDGASDMVESVSDCQQRRFFTLLEVEGDSHRRASELEAEVEKLRQTVSQLQSQVAAQQAQLDDAGFQQAQAIAEAVINAWETAKEIVNETRVDPEEDAIATPVSPE